MSFAAYLSRDRARALASGTTLPPTAWGAALFADISGFTPLTDALVRELGPHAGVDALTRRLNEVYDALIGVIHAHGGDVVAFSGDALTCWFAGQDAASADRRLHDAAWQAAACAVALQEAMQQQADVQTPAGQRFPLGLKVAFVAGQVRRLLVGDPAIRQLDIVAGEALDRLAAAEHQAARGDIVADAATATMLGGHVQIAAWRRDAATQTPVALIGAVARPALLPAHPAAAPGSATLTFAQARPLMLPWIAERLAHGQRHAPTELRPAVALFLRFATLDYDNDASAGARLDRYIRWVQTLIARYGGTLLDVSIGDKGSSLYAAFGAPIARENDAERAVRAALDLLHAPPDIAMGAVQIGLARGTMRTGAYGGSGRLTYGVLGDAVNVAARLMQAAPAGHIFVRDAVEMPGADLFAWQGLPPLRVKGKPQPIAVFRLLHAREHPTPDFFAGQLVGRAAELERLLEAARPALAGQFAGVAIISGEAGVGKSRLVFELRQRVQALAGVTWAYCPSDEILRGSLRPFATWLRAYFDQSAQHSEAENARHFAATLDALIAGHGAGANGQPTAANEQLSAELARTRSFLAALIGVRSEGSLYEQLEPKLRFENTLLALTALIRAESQRQPLVLEFEDAHWLDDDSQTLLENLTRSLAGHPVLILCAARPSDEGRMIAPPLAENTPVCAVELDTLTFDGTRTLATQLLYSAVNDELAQFVYQRTGGNPFFAEQLLLDLRERGMLDDRRRAADDGATRVALRAAVGRPSALDEVPGTLNSLLVARLDRLTEDVREVVQAAAVLGREWALPVLVAMRSGDAGLPPKVRAAEDGRVWSPLSERDYLFRHVLLRDAAYKMQLQAQRRELHAQAAHAIETEYGDTTLNDDVLLYHWQQAGSTERAYPYVQRVARRLIATTGKYEQAYAMLEPVETSFHSDDARRIPLLLLQVWALWRTGEYAAAHLKANEALALAEASGDVQGQADSLNYLGQLTRDQGVYERAHSYHMQSLSSRRSINDQAGISESLNHLGNLANDQGDYDQAKTYYLESLAIREALGDLYGVGNSMNNLGLVVGYQGDYEQALQYHQQSLDLRRHVGYQAGVAASFLNLGNLALLQSDYSQAEQLYTESLLICRDLGELFLVTAALDCLGQLAYRQKRFNAACNYLQEELSIQRKIGSQFQYISLSFLVGIMIKLGRLEDAYAYLREAITFVSTSSSKRTKLIVLFAAVEVLFVERRTVQAIRLIGLLLTHPANEDEARLLAKQLLEEYTGQHSSLEIENTLVEGQHLDVDAVVTELLAEYGNVSKPAKSS